MITAEEILSIPKDALPPAATLLDQNEIGQLVGWLSLTDDKVRYQAFLLLQQRSALKDDVFPFWDVFAGKLTNDNSYQRSIGLMLLAENARWDTAEKTDAVIEPYLALLHDEKPVTIRQCIQSLPKILPFHPKLAPIVGQRLMELDLMGVRETMQKLILTDILNVLLLIRKIAPNDSIEAYIVHALSGEILDAKSKKAIASQLK